MLAWVSNGNGKRDKREYGQVCGLPWRLLTVETLSPYLTPSYPKVLDFHSHLHATTTSLYALPTESTELCAHLHYFIL